MSSRIAGSLRTGFEWLGDRVPRVLVVGGLAAASFVVYRHMLHSLSSCSPDARNLLPIELTFSATRLAALKALTGEPCRGRIGASFFPDDFAFSILYALTLSAVVMWAERCFRYSAWDEPENADPDSPPEWLATFMVSAPMFAGLLDILGENIPLMRAWNHMPPVPDGGWNTLVIAESCVSALKWALIGAVGLWIVFLLLSGWRGRVLRRSRFSVLTIVLGAIPLLLIDQGQDVLSSIAEDQRRLALILGVSALVVAGLAAWWCARVLVLIQFPDDRPRDEGGWAEFFEREIPRMLAVAVMLLGAAALARASSPKTLTWFTLGVAGAFVLGTLARWKGSAWLERIGGILLPGWLDAIPGLAVDLAQGILMVVVFAAVMHFAPGREDPDQVQRVAGEYLKRAATWATVLSVLVYILVYYRRRVIAAYRGDALKASRTMLPERHSPDAVPRISRVVATVAAVVSASFFLWFLYRDAVPAGRTIGAFAILCLAAANAVFLGSVTVYFGRRYRVPLVSGGVALAILFSLWNDSHRVELIDSREPPQRPTIEDYFRGWLAARAQEHAAGDTLPVILVAASGGGLRAAYWTALALGTLADRRPAFAHHVFAISGVSGGSLGGAVFAALVKDAGSPPDSSCLSVGGDSSYTHCVHRILRDDFLSPVLAKMLAPDFTQLFIPAPIWIFDRSRALERGWAESYQHAVKDDAFSRGFLDLWQTPGAGTAVPALLLNATSVEWGKRIVASPFRTAGTLLDAYDLHAMLRADIALKSAAHNSARFTYVSPAAMLRNDSGAVVGHAVDGGYFENSGLATLGDLYHHLNGLALQPGYMDSTSPRLGALHTVFVVLYLCNDPVACPAERAGILPLASRPDPGTEELGPIRALAHAREARGSLARAELEHESGIGRSMRFLELDVCAEPTRADTSAADSTAKERVKSPPLGWLLSPTARKVIEQSLSRSVGPCGKQNQAALKAILDTIVRPKTGSR
ncbi:MAG: hypothetical protein ACJ8DC_10840 [Gemmatimonadales bacterium]